MVGIKVVMSNNISNIMYCLDESEPLPTKKSFLKNIRRAPKRSANLSRSDYKLALKNALRYIPKKFHEEIAPEFLEELEEFGRIYGYRFRPEGNIKAKTIDDYESHCLEGKAFQLMIDNNLDFEIALYPYELVTYGETGQVCQNWMQYLLIKKYLKNLTDQETLQIYSGHPVGSFPSFKTSPRVITVNALMIGMFDNAEEWARAQAIGVANYGQMTAGGWMYIGPQGIVHGTYNTLVIAGRKKLGLGPDDSLKGKTFISSGLGGMSGAQGKAIEIAQCTGIIAEVDLSRIETRKNQGWVSEIAKSPKEAFQLVKKSIANEKPTAIAFHGNIIDLLKYAVENNEPIDLLSDQTSCHAVYEGGYCPSNISFEERTNLLKTDKEKFKTLVNKSLKEHFELIKTLSERGTYFFDYGNAFLKSVYDAGVQEVLKNGVNEKDGFIYQSYVEDLLGPELFDYGYGPFRWVCLSGKQEDLDKTDECAAECIRTIRPKLRYQDIDNLNWVLDAKGNNLVVGTKARILYQDAIGRKEIALAFNSLVRDKKTGPIMLGRDHHDTGGTDSPFRETANIKDGSNIMADMATSVFAGNAARGMSLVALHNGGGVGISKSINGGFGLLLDGSKKTDQIIESALIWDVMGGVSRRAWATNENAIEAVSSFLNTDNNACKISLPSVPENDLLENTIKNIQTQ